MPRFKNPHLVPKVVGDGIPVAPGDFVVIDDPDESVLRDLVQVPDEPAPAPTPAPADEPAPAPDEAPVPNASADEPPAPAPKKTSTTRRSRAGRAEE